MKLRLEWSRPIRLKDGSRENLIYTLDLTKIPSGAGVYIFGRTFGNSFEALYVGKASHVRWRVRTQLKNLPLMLHLQKAKIGKKFLMMGRFIPKPGQREAVCLPLLERALIRYFMSKSHDLVNKHGTLLRRHEITSAHVPSRFVPGLMFVDRSKGG